MIEKDNWLVLVNTDFNVRMPLNGAISQYNQEAAPTWQTCQTIIQFCAIDISSIKEPYKVIGLHAMQQIITI